MGELALSRAALDRLYVLRLSGGSPLVCIYDPLPTSEQLPHVQEYDMLMELEHCAREAAAAAAAAVARAAAAAAVAAATRWPRLPEAPSAPPGTPAASTASSLRTEPAAGQRRRRGGSPPAGVSDAASAPRVSRQRLDAVGEPPRITASMDWLSPRSAGSATPAEVLRQYHKLYDGYQALVLKAGSGIAGGGGGGGADRGAGAGADADAPTAGAGPSIGSTSDSDAALDTSSDSDTKEHTWLVAMVQPSGRAAPVPSARPYAQLTTFVLKHEKAAPNLVKLATSIAHLRFNRKGVPAKVWEACIEAIPAALAAEWAALEAARSAAR